MKPLKFNLSSEQLELMLAFEETQGLGPLSERMARDPSVISRNLQKIADDLPVLEKIKGRWEITALGLQTNALTRQYLKEHQDLLYKMQVQKAETEKLHFTKTSVLIIINAQKGLLEAVDGRNNIDAERNIFQILSHWRTADRPILHIQHISENPKSYFYRHSVGCEFLDLLKPLPAEKVIIKSKSSGFTETTLEATLNQINCDKILIVGFTANECIDATARDANHLGFTTYVVEDGSATFDLRDSTGKLLRADRVHRLTMANINAFYAQVIKTVDTIMPSKV